MATVHSSPATCTRPDRAVTWCTTYVRPASASTPNRSSRGRARCRAATGPTRPARTPKLHGRGQPDPRNACGERRGATQDAERGGQGERLRDPSTTAMINQATHSAIRTHPDRSTVGDGRPGPRRPGGVHQPGQHQGRGEQAYPEHSRAGTAPGGSPARTAAPPAPTADRPSTACPGGSDDGGRPRRSDAARAGSSWSSSFSITVRTRCSCGESGSGTCPRAPMSRPPRRRPSGPRWTGCRGCRRSPGRGSARGLPDQVAQRGAERPVEPADRWDRHRRAPPGHRRPRLGRPGRAARVDGRRHRQRRQLGHPHLRTGRSG